ncbi:MAG: DedA family protein [Promicromonosporaceae bacterium]|nr:DedA family protein [Promicromonosporaceae bacterium]
MYWLGQVEAWVLTAAAEVWIYPLLFVMVVADGIFPPVPSEAVLLSLAAIHQTPGTPPLLALFLVGALGAWCGDQLAYAVGRVLGTDRTRLLRGSRGQAAVAWAYRSLARHGTSFIIATRYLPVIRVAVPIAAGAVRYPRRAFMRVTAVSSLLWSAYMLATGLLAGVWFEEYPLAAMSVGVVAGLIVGLLADRLARTIMGWRGIELGEETLTTSATAPAVENDPAPL